MKLGVLLVAYGSANFRGTSTLRAVQLAAEQRFGLPVRWAFTSETMRQKLADSKTKSDSVFKALSRMYFEKYTHVAVQSLHVIPGSEFKAVASDCCMSARETKLNIALGLPLLADIENSYPQAIEETARILVRHVPKSRKADEPVLYMAHGSQSDGAALYKTLDDHVRKLDPNIFIASMISFRRDRDNSPDDLHYILSELKNMGNSHAVWLLPMLSLVGKHTLTDMAGTSGTSWKQRIEATGLQCRAELRSLADDPAFLGQWFNRLEYALGRLISGHGGDTLLSNAQA